MHCRACVQGFLHDDWPLDYHPCDSAYIIVPAIVCYSCKKVVQVFFHKLTLDERVCPGSLQRKRQYPCRPWGTPCRPWGTPGRALLQARFAGTVMASLSDEEKLALQVGGLSPAALRAAQARLSDTTFVLGPLISNNLTVYDVHAFHAGEAWRHKHLQSDGVRPTATCRTQRPHMRLH